MVSFFFSIQLQFSKDGNYLYTGARKVSFNTFFIFMQIMIN